MSRIDTSELATKGDVLALKTDLAELKADLIKHTNELLVKMTAVYAGIVILILSIFGILIRTIP